MKPFVSIIVPCRNEASFIRGALDSLLGNAYPRERFEVIIVDGMSTDATSNIADEYEKHYAFVRCLRNPKQTAAAALNLGFAKARGDIIMRADAHAVYPSNYVEGLVNALLCSAADNVGPLWITEPANDSPSARAIALALRHPFGVGNARFRIGARERCWVDTVPFGCYRRSVFERIGLFDEDLIRNQDDEFNLRLIRNGGRILLVPDITVRYYARDSLGKLARMYYQYGYFKPLVVRKLGAVMTWRQVVPSLFLLALICFGTFATWNGIARIGLLGLLAVYLAVVVVCAAQAAFGLNVRCAAALCCAFVLMHISYGLGFINGCRVFLLRLHYKSPGSANMPISR